MAARVSPQGHRLSSSSSLLSRRLSSSARLVFPAQAFSESLDEDLTGSSEPSMRTHWPCRRDPTKLFQCRSFTVPPVTLYQIVTFGAGSWHRQDPARFIQKTSEKFRANPGRTKAGAPEIAIIDNCTRFQPPVMEAHIRRLPS